MLEIVAQAPRTLSDNLQCITLNQQEQCPIEPTHWVTYSGSLTGVAQCSSVLGPLFLLKSSNVNFPVHSPSSRFITIVLNARLLQLIYWHR